jgi:hypothetical protein
MVRRIVIACEHDRTEEHPLPNTMPAYSLGSVGVAYNRDNMCPGGRVLDPGSYVLIEKVDGEWPAPGSLDPVAHRVLAATAAFGCPDGASAVWLVLLDALAGGEQP